jgi:hypothetical protein
VSGRSRKSQQKWLEPIIYGTASPFEITKPELVSTNDSGHHQIKIGGSDRTITDLATIFIGKQRLLRTAAFLNTFSENFESPLVPPPFHKASTGKAQAEESEASGLRDGRISRCRNT